MNIVSRARRVQDALGEPLSEGDSTVLYFTRVFVGGPFAGVAMNDYKLFSSAKEAIEWAKKGKEGIENWKVIKASFQKYWRDR